MPLKLALAFLLSLPLFGQYTPPGGGGGGSGTVTSVSGTANQVCVATGTTTPVLSICTALDLSGLTSTKPIKSGTSLPATCGVGEFYDKTDATAGSNLYSCTATNTWTVVGGGASPAGSAVTDAQCWASASTFGVCANINSNLTGTVTGHATLDAPLASPTFTGTVTIPTGGVFGTPASMTATNVTGLPIAGLTGLGTGIATALAANVSGSGAICLATGSACAPNSGTVTTVGFTGGLISVANPTTAPALTVAGTSGGVPYFSGAATWASSGAGVQNAMMTWGGAGNAPTSPLSLLVTSQNAAGETWTWYNSTATTGKTTAVFREGAGGAASDPWLEYFLNNGTSIAGGIFRGAFADLVTVGANSIVLSSGSVSAANWSNPFSTSINSSIVPSGINANQAWVISWDAANTANGTVDVSLQRDAAGILSIYNSSSQGTTAANYRAIKASAYYIAGTTFTASGCSNGTLTGGSSAGTFTLGANSCNVVVTMGNSATAPNGWSCRANDQTANTILIPQGASSTTTATFEIPAGAGASDVINFACLGY